MKLVDIRVRPLDDVPNGLWRAEITLLGYVVEHFTGPFESVEATARIKANEVNLVAKELLKDLGWSKS